MIKKYVMLVELVPKAVIAIFFFVNGHGHDLSKTPIILGWEGGNRHTFFNGRDLRRRVTHIFVIYRPKEQTQVFNINYTYLFVEIFPVNLFSWKEESLAQAKTF